jgi:hypothetical protein
MPRVRSRPADQPLVPTWARVLVICTVIPVWCALMIYSLYVLKSLPGAEWTIVPSGVIAAVAPAWRVRRADDDNQREGGTR